MDEDVDEDAQSDEQSDEQSDDACYGELLESSDLDVGPEEDLGGIVASLSQKGGLLRGLGAPLPPRRIPSPGTADRGGAGLRPEPGPVASPPRAPQPLPLPHTQRTSRLVLNLDCPEYNYVIGGEDEEDDEDRDREGGVGAPRPALMGTLDISGLALALERRTPPPSPSHPATTEGAGRAGGVERTERARQADRGRDKCPRPPSAGTAADDALMPAPMSAAAPASASGSATEHPSHRHHPHPPARLDHSDKSGDDDDPDLRSVVSRASTATSSTGSQRSLGQRLAAGLLTTSMGAGLGLRKSGSIGARLSSLSTIAEDPTHSHTKTNAHAHAHTDNDPVADAGCIFTAGSGGSQQQSQQQSPAKDQYRSRSGTGTSSAGTTLANDSGSR